MREVGGVRNSRAFVAEGIRSYHDGDLAAALDSFTKAVNKAPNHPDLRCRKATVLGELGRMREAIDELSVALELNPSYEEARLKRGVARLQLGSFLEAAADFDRVLKNGPSNDELELLHGIALLKGGKPDAALPHLTTATLSGNTAIRAAYFLAQAHVTLDRHDRAIAVLESHPSPSNLVLLGKLHMETGSFSKAATSFEQALDQGERTPAVHLCIAQAKFNTGDTTVAMAHAKFALGDPTTADEAAFLLLAGRVRVGERSAGAALADQAHLEPRRVSGPRAAGSDPGPGGASRGGEEPSSSRPSSDSRRATTRSARWASCCTAWARRKRGGTCSPIR